MDTNLASSPRGLDENLSRDVEFLVQITNRSRWPETSITGVLEPDENDITKSKIRASIDAATISTREPQRDAHLKGADFFHVEKHSALTFNSTVISKNADGELKVSGDLTIRGVTRNMVFDVEGPSPAQKDP